MHELSLAANILDIVDEAAQRDPFERVHTLHLSAPALSGVDVPALRFALESLAPGTRLEAAQVLIDTPPVRARCPACEAEAQIEAHAQMCPRCGAEALRPMEPSALRVIDLRVA
jgi:hydrogenase nickel incorporation protein HypA/HybF